ncbi:hypothetical protein L1887_03744 [Cichorium endivia]|nr:hypothetical protein L1887_03744 [Cichorium endivia]
MATNGLGLDITELRLGLPGGNGNGERNEKKRLFLDILGGQWEADFSVNGAGGDRKSQNTEAVVGWPPVCSYRKKTMTKKYVKVSMDGVPFLRKIDHRCHISLRIYSLSIRFHPSKAKIRLELDFASSILSFNCEGNSPPSPPSSPSNFSSSVCHYPSFRFNLFFFRFSPTDLSLSQPNDFDHNTEGQPIYFQSDSIVPSEEDMIRWHLFLLLLIHIFSFQFYPNYFLYRCNLFTGNTNASVITSSNFAIYNLQSLIGPI